MRRHVAAESLGILTAHASSCSRRSRSGQSTGERGTAIADEDLAGRIRRDQAGKRRRQSFVAMTSGS